MSAGNEKWILVEWGNCTRGIVHSRYLVNADNRELQAGCSVVVGRRGEQQIATYLARSNERLLLEQILKQADAQAEGAETKPPAVEEPGDFSGSASSEWAPSGDDASDSSAPEDDKDEKDEKPELVQNVPVKEEDPPRKRNTKRVLTPSNRVNAIIPISMKKGAAKTKNNNNTSTRKRKHNVMDKENISIENPNVPSLKEEPLKPKTINISINVDDVIIMNNMFKELFKVFRNIRRLQNTGSPERVIEVMHPKTEDNDTVTPEDDENESEKSGCEEDLNRSDDNVLISNKYGNIENNTPNVTQNSTQNVTKHSTLNVTKNSTLNVTKHSTLNVTKNSTLNGTKNSTLNGTKNCTQNITRNSSQNITHKEDKGDVYNIQNEDTTDEWVPIGSGKTLIHRDTYRKIKWSSYTMATRGLLLAVFPRRVLATHSLTGKRSPAFQNKPAKMCLDPKKVSDIIIEVMDKFRIRENLIRSIITTKCADEGKMFRMRMEKKKRSLKNKAMVHEPPNNENPPEENLVNQ